MTSRAHARETAASSAQYLLLGGFAAVAAGISARGLTGFARDNMALRGPWPYPLRLALHASDRTARNEAAAPRRVRTAERRAHAALTRARFADPDTAASVFRQVQMLTRTPDFARLDSTTPQPPSPA